MRWILLSWNYLHRQQQPATIILITWSFLSGVLFRMSIPHKTMVMRNGDLASAVRGSMTIPFIFKPITIHGKLVFDGGMYNNFPVDIAKKDFRPDVIIGSRVAQAV